MKIYYQSIRIKKLSSQLVLSNCYNLLKLKKLNRSASRMKQRGHDLLIANRKEEKSHYVSLNVLEMMSLNHYALAGYDILKGIKCWYD